MTGVQTCALPISCDPFFPLTDFQLDYSKLYGEYQKNIVATTNISWNLGYKNSPLKTTLPGFEAFLDDRYAHDRPMIGPGVWDGFDGPDSDMGKLSTNNSNCTTPASASDCGYVRYFKDHPALYAWLWDDEPNLGGDSDYVPATAELPQYGLKEWLDTTRTLDDNHPVANMFAGISNDFTNGTESDRIKAASYVYGDKIHTSDIWMLDYYPYEYRRHAAEPDLEGLAQSVDNAIAYNRGLHPVWVMVEDQDLHDYYGGIWTVWNTAELHTETNYVQWESSTEYAEDDARKEYNSSTGLYNYIVQTETTCTSGSTEPTWANYDIGDDITDGNCTWHVTYNYSNARQIIADGYLFTLSSIPCVTGASEPTWPASFGTTVNDGTCTWRNDGTYANKVVNIASWDSGTFQTGERVCATSGCGVASGVIGMPMIGGSYTQTDISYIRKADDYNNYSCNQIVMSSIDGDFSTSQSITGQTSGAMATTGSAVYYRESSTGLAKPYDWTPGPTPEQASNMLWISIVHGVRGYGYFSYFTGAKDDVITKLTADRAIIEDIDDILFTPLSPKISPTGYNQWVAATVTGARVDYTVREYDGKTYVIAARVNRKTDANPWPDPSNDDDRSATMTISGLESGTTVAVYGEDRSITAGDGTITDNFLDYENHIYYFPADGGSSGKSQISGTGKMQISETGTSYFSD